MDTARVDPLHRLATATKAGNATHRTAIADAAVASRAQAMLSAAQDTSDDSSLPWLSIDRLAGSLSAEPAGSPVVAEALDRVPWMERDDVTRSLYALAGKSPQAMRRYSVDARARMLSALREGWVTKNDRHVYRAIAPGYRTDATAVSRAQLRNPAYVAELRTQLLADFSVAPQKVVTFNGARLRRMGDAAPSHSQVVVDKFYRGLVESPSKKSEIDAALATPLVTDPATGRPARLDGLTLYRPGIGNVPPSAANLLRWARYTAQQGHGKLVLMYGHQSPQPESALRRLTSYQGVAIPSDLEVYAVGDEHRVLHSAATEADTFIEQLEILRRDGSNKELGITLNLGQSGPGARVIAHSQGNHAVARARLALAAAGYPNLVTSHIALSSAAGGSPFADDNTVGWTVRGVAGAATFLSNGSYTEGRDAVAYLDPDNARAQLPPFMWDTFDLAFVGLARNKQQTSRASGSMRGTDGLLHALGAKLDATDGMIPIDSGATDDPRRDVVSEKNYDHLSMISSWEAADDVVPHITSRE